MPDNFNQYSQDNRRRYGSSICNCGGQWNRRDDRRDERREHRDDRHDDHRDNRHNNYWPWG